MLNSFKTYCLVFTSLSFLCVFLFYIIPPSQPKNISPIRFYPCDKFLNANQHITIKCGIFKNSVTVDNQSNIVFSLRFAILIPQTNTISPLKIKNKQLTSDRLPLLYIEGGPGVGNVVTPKSLVYWQQFIDQQKINRPLIIFNPLGTKGSLPNPKCDSFYKMQYALLNSRNQTEIDDYNQQVDESLRHCLNKIHSVDIYASRIQKQAVLKMMQALNFDQWHVLGSSYGVRMALLLGQEPQVKKLILDAPYLWHQGVYSHDVKLYFNALHLLEKKWNANNDDMFDHDFSQVLSNAIFNLSRTQIFIKVRNRRHKDTYLLKDVNYLLTPKRLFELGFFSLYSTHNTQQFFALLNTLNQKSKSSITYTKNRLVDQYIDSYMDTSFNPLTYYLVECQDNRFSTSEEVRHAIEQAHESFIKSNMRYKLNDWQSILQPFKQVLMQDYIAHPCRNSHFHDRYHVNNMSYPKKTMLFLTGEYDPITPSMDLHLLPKSQNIHVIVKNDAGHGILTSQSCDEGLIEQYLNDAPIKNIVPLCQSLK